MTDTPKKLWFRTLASGKTSVGEYIGAKWRNVVDPFMFATELESIEHLSFLIARFKRETSREVIAICKDQEARSVAKYIGLDIV